MKQKKKRSLNTKVFIALFIFAIITIVGTCINVGIRYWNDKMDNYTNEIFSLTRIAADYVDGDRVLTYLDTMEKDEYYDEVMEYLNVGVRQTNIRYFYIFVPYENDLVYVWDADINEGSCELGQHEDYMENGPEIVKQVFKENPAEEISIVRDDTYGYIASAYSPIFNTDGEPVALVGIDLSMPNLQSELSRFMVTMIVSITVLTVFIFICFSIYIRRNLVTPIKEITSESKIMVENLEKERDTNLNIHTGDELEDLAGALGQMNLEIRQYIHQLSAVTAEKERIGAELDVAAQIQNDMLPRIFPPFPEREEFELYATMTPAKEVGGDFYDFFLVDDDHLALVIADVSGKGVPAALFMMISKMLIKNAVQAGLQPKAALEKVNKELCENNDAEMFVTVWLGILEISTGRMVCANAGHEYPAICRAGGQFELLKDKHGMVIGAMESMRYTQYEIELSAGDRLFVYTDGVAEATASNDELFGTDRITQALTASTAENSKELLADMHAAIDEFVGDAPQFDDITMLAIGMKSLGGDAMKKINVEPTLSSIEEVTQFVEGILNEHDVPRALVNKMDIVIDEILSNIVHYSEATTATIGCAAADGCVTLRFSDNGLAYDPTQNATPDIESSAEERKIGGMGIYMVKKFMDSVEYEYKDGLNVLTLKKSL